jgi:hypothetical protein
MVDAGLTALDGSRPRPSSAGLDCHKHNETTFDAFAGKWRYLVVEASPNFWGASRQRYRHRAAS